MFWKSSLLNDPKGHLKERANKGGEAMGNMGRMTSIKDLPPDKSITDFIKQHMKLNEAGIKIEKKPKPKKELVVSKELISALIKSKKAITVFENFSVSQKREYAEWVAEAKTAETKNKRIETAVEWIAEGKQRNWKYMKKY
jgi:uncharacterized protein YdeI (YjbR/CyaY-like superfamily)